MSSLKQYREKLNLTQQELSDKSGISIRTIQRIESGIEPKGQTLKILAKTLGVKEDELLNKDKGVKEVELLEKEIIVGNNYTGIKIINLSSLPFTLIPLANFIIPLLIMFVIKQFSPLAKQIVSIQILWLILAVIIFMLSAFIEKAYSLGNNFMLIVIILLVLSNVFIILRNAAEIDKKGKLFFKLNFSLI